MKRCYLLMLAMTACGRVNFEALERDATAADRPLCTSSFDPPVVIAELASPYDEGCPELTDDGLEIFWHDTEPAGIGGSDVWTAVRASTLQPFGPRMLVTSVNTTFNEGGPSLSFDGLELYFSSERAGLNKGDLYVARRASRTAPFEAPQRIAEVDSTEYESSPFLSADGLTLYFGSNRADGSGSNDIWFATRAIPSGLFAAPQSLAFVSTSDSENTPTLTANGLSLFYEVTGNVGKADLWVATRASTTEPFSPGTVVAELSLVNSEDVTPSVSASGERITFSSDRGSTYDPFVAVRRCP